MYTIATWDCDKQRFTVDSPLSLLKYAGSPTKAKSLFALRNAIRSYRLEYGDDFCRNVLVKRSGIPIGLRPHRKITVRKMAKTPSLFSETP